MGTIAPITKCRLCKCKTLTRLFSLGEQYVSDFIDDPNTYDGIAVPISLVLCPECTLVQLEHTAPQDFMYTKHYWYRSGVTLTMRRALRDVAECVENCVFLTVNDIVLDIGSNDGTLLRSYTNPALRVGFEPAVNLAEEGAEGVDRFINDFWSYETYEELVGEPAKVITALGMFYDLEDPNKFIKDIFLALAEDGVFIAQLMCLRNMLNIADIGNLAHEHLEFYSLRSLDYVFNKYGMEIVDIYTNKVNGESYRLFIRPINGSFQPVPGAEKRVAAAREAEEGLDNPVFYAELLRKMECNKQAIRRFIRTEVNKGRTVYVYGASTKGNVILQYYDLAYPLITAAAERSPEKWGRYTVGTNIPIITEAQAREDNPDYFLVLPYAFIDEFLKREQAWRQGGGKFIVPLPEMMVL